MTFVPIEREWNEIREKGLLNDEYGQNRETHRKAAYR